MLKNLILYRINGDMAVSAAALERALEKATFAPCGKTQPRSLGWTPPRGIGHGALVETNDGQWIVALMIEQRILPAAVIARRVDELAAKIEADTGRRPGNKARRELKEQAMHELLPKAFTRRQTIMAWIDPKAKLLAIDASSQSAADVVAGALVQCAPQMNLHIVSTEHAPRSVMALWLQGHGDERFMVAREGELRADDESKAVVRYQNHSLDSDEVRGHLAGGKAVARLALVFDDRLSFVLTDKLAIKKLVLLGIPMEEGHQDNDDAFSANVAIITGELRRMLPALLDVMGGEQKLPLETSSDGDDSELGDPTPVDTGEASTDSLYERACGIVREAGRVSISLVQRHLSIGYNRAARLIERMEIEGLVSPQTKDGSRKVLAADDVGAPS